MSHASSVGSKCALSLEVSGKFGSGNASSMGFSGHACSMGGKFALGLSMGSLTPSVGSMASGSMSFVPFFGA